VPAIGFPNSILLVPRLRPDSIKIDHTVVCNLELREEEFEDTGSQAMPGNKRAWPLVGSCQSLFRHTGESRYPVHIENTGFLLSQE
jgi:hypothetical protein